MKSLLETIAESPNDSFSKTGNGKSVKFFFPKYYHQNFTFCNPADLSLPNGRKLVRSKYEKEKNTIFSKISFSTVKFLKTFPWTHRMQFWQPCRYFFRHEVKILFSQSTKRFKNLILQKNIFFLCSSLWISRMQIWRPCWKCFC